MAAVRRVRTEIVNAADLLDEIAAELLVRRFAGEDLVRLDAEPRQRRRLHGKRLRRPGLFAGDIALRNRPLLDGVDRLAGFALEKEHQARLRHRDDGGNSPPVADDVHQRGRGRVVVVPHVVVRQLKVPADFAGVGIERDDRRGIQILLRAMAAVVLRRRLADRQEDQPALGVDRAEAPVRGRARGHPVVLRPGVVAGLARVRDRVEGPDQLAGSDIPRADVHRRAFGVVLLPLRAGDDQVPVDDPGRGHHVRHLRELVGDARAQVDRALIAEGRHRLSRRGVEREQTAVGGSREDSRRAAGRRPASTTRRGSARRPSRARASRSLCPSPDPARRSSAARWTCRARRARKSGRPGSGRPTFTGTPGAGDAVLPGELQLRDVLRVDLGERRISPALRRRRCTLSTRPIESRSGRRDSPPQCTR